MIKKYFCLVIFFISAGCSAQIISPFNSTNSTSEGHVQYKSDSVVKWQANWIIDPNSQNTSNSWFCFRKEVSLDSIPATAIAKIAVDSKYWLWVNEKLVIFEGGLKRGPNPRDIYYDRNGPDLG